MFKRLIIVFLISIQFSLLLAQHKVLTLDSNQINLEILKVNKNLLSCKLGDFSTEIDRDSLLGFEYDNQYYVNKTIYEWKYGKYPKPSINWFSFGTQTVVGLGLSSIATLAFSDQIKTFSFNQIEEGLRIPTYLLLNTALSSLSVYFLDFDKNNQSSLKYTLIGTTTGLFVGMTTTLFAGYNQQGEVNNFGTGMLIASPIIGGLLGYYSSYSKKGVKLYRGWHIKLDQNGYGVALNLNKLSN